MMMHLDRRVSAFNLTIFAVLTEKAWGVYSCSYMLGNFEMKTQLYSSSCLENRVPPGRLGRVSPGNAKGGSITVPLTSCLTGLD